MKLQSNTDGDHRAEVFLLDSQGAQVKTSMDKTDNKIQGQLWLRWLRGLSNN